MWCNISSLLGSLRRGKMNMANNLPPSCVPVLVPLVLSMSPKMKRRKYAYITPTL